MAGNLWVWGSNGYGVLGDNDFPNPKSSPVQTIAGGSTWQTASTNSLFGAAIKTDGTLWAWGRNSYGQVGDNTTVNKSSPVQTVTFSTDWASVHCGVSSMAAIKKDGTLWTWGYNSYGQLGDDTSTNRSSPVQTAAFGNNWKQVSGGYAHKAAVKTDGTLWTWGYNYYGQLGDGTKSSFNKKSPIQTVSYGTDWNLVACGNSFTVAIKKDGTLWAWGINGYGQLGNNTTTNRSSPVQEITGGTNWSTVACGYAVTVATKTDGTLWTWGANLAGEIGDNTFLAYKSSPVQTIAGGTNWASAHAGSFRAGGIKKDGTLWIWGLNNPNGQVGDDSNIDRSSPVQTIMGGTGWTSLSMWDAVFAINSPPQPSLSVNTAPAYVYSGKQFGVQPVIYILDPSLVLDTGATDAVTVTVTSGNATISGTATVSAVGGIVTYTNLVLTGYGPVTLDFSATGITSTSVNVNVEIAGAVLPKRSENASVVPTSGQLLVGELAINIADRKGYVKKSDGTIVNVFDNSQINGGFY